MRCWYRLRDCLYGCLRPLTIAALINDIQSPPWLIGLFAFHSVAAVACFWMRVDRALPSGVARRNGSGAGRLGSFRKSLVHGE